MSGLTLPISNNNIFSSALEPRYRKHAYSEDMDIVYAIRGPNFSFLYICAFVSLYSEDGCSAKTNVKKIKDQQFTIMRVINSGVVSLLNERGRVGGYEALSGNQQQVLAGSGARSASLFSFKSPTIFSFRSREPRPCR